MARIKVDGLEELQKILKKNITMDDVKRAVERNGKALQRNMQSKADFRMGYQTGQTKRSIGIEILDGGMTAEVGPETDYAPYVEYGTRFMEAQPFVRPAEQDQREKFKRDMQKLVR